MNLKITTLFFTLIILTIFISCSSKSPTKVEKPAYIVEDVTFESNGLTLEGTVYLPKHTSKVPGVVFVNGSGPVDRDGTVKNNPSAMPPIYKNWANLLSTNGIASLRYDKRFLTHPQLNPLELTQEDQIEDIVAALLYLKSHSEIDTTKIFIIGHSEGGNIAPVAADRISSIAGVIIIASCSFAIDTLFIEQLKANENISQDLITQTEQAFLLLRNIQFPVGGQIWGGGESYWREWIYYSENAGNEILKLEKPVFIQQGLEDENFPSFTLQKNISIWENLDNQSSKISFKTYENVTHLILKKNTQEMASNVLNDILDWINKN